MSICNGSYLAKVLVHLVVTVLFASCASNADVINAGQLPRTPAQVLTEIGAAQAEADTCRKLIDKPLRCLP